MIRTFWVPMASVIMLVELLMLPFHLRDLRPDYPQIQLPTAAYGRHFGDFRSMTEFSWTTKGGWVIAGVGAIRDEGIEPYLRKHVEKVGWEGGRSKLRVRVPADAPAIHFMTMARRAQLAGVEVLFVAVLRPNPPWR
jgi:hypothetical protein